MLALLPLLLAAQDLPPALARAETTYRTLHTLRAEFTQAIENPMLGAPEVTTGTLWLAPPDRFAMRFTNGDRLIADGVYFWAWTPSTVDDQVIRQPIPRTGALTPNLFGQFVDQPARRYQIERLAPDTVEGVAVEVIRLLPRDEEAAGFRRADLSIDRTGMIRRIALIESTGQRRTLVFRDITPGAAVPPDEVRFTVPRGVRVVGTR
ncbi:MAG: outer membrane lipoprotein carrier protein LolA [Gemmatimonadales bacterium]